MLEGELGKNILPNIGQLRQADCTPRRKEEPALNPSELTHHMDIPIEQKWATTIKIIKTDVGDTRCVEEAIKRAPINKATEVDESFIEALQIGTNLSGEIISNCGKMLGNKTYEGGLSNRTICTETKKAISTNQSRTDPLYYYHMYKRELSRRWPQPYEKAISFTAASSASEPAQARKWL